jgi:hypothetical protein
MFNITKDFQKMRKVNQVVCLKNENDITHVTKTARNIITADKVLEFSHG